jgi:hypothetical protein
MKLFYVIELVLNIVTLRHIEETVDTGKLFEEYIVQNRDSFP